jgi:hypothetical protein
VVPSSASAIHSRCRARHSSSEPARGQRRSGLRAVYAYVFDGSGWTLQQKLVAPDGLRGDRFGQSLSLDGDELAVGAPRRDVSGGRQRGRHYGVRPLGVDLAVGSLARAPEPRPADNLGTSVAIQGDVLVAGAPDDDSAAPMAGAVRLWRRLSGSWSGQAALVAPGTTAGDACGISVALDGDRVASGCLWREGPALGSDGAVDVWSGVLGGRPMTARMPVSIARIALLALVALAARASAQYAVDGANGGGALGRRSPCVPTWMATA